MRVAAARQYDAGRQQRIDGVQHAAAIKAVFAFLDGVGGGLGPVHPCLLPRRGRVQQQFRRARGFGADAIRQFDQVVQLGADVVVLRVQADAAEDQAMIAIAQGRPADRRQLIPAILIADAARHVDPRRARRNQRVTAAKQQTRGQGHGLAVLGHARDLDQQRLALGHALAIAQIARLAIRQAQEHAALPLHEAVGRGTTDRAGRQRGQRIAGHQQVDQLTVLHQGCGFEAEQMPQNDLATLHRASSLILGWMPIAASMAAVSDRGRPTTAENDPSSHGMKAAAAPWMA